MKNFLVYLLLLFSSFLFAQKSIVSEEILIKNDSILLPGTLSFNSEPEKQPLIIFVSGSGNPDRNGNQPQFGVNGNYIKQLSDAMTDKNVAFFRFDKRNVTKENIPQILKHYVFSDLVDDVTAIIEHFKNDPRFDSITLVGHSQGSLVAMMAANQYVDKYVSLAGIGEPVGGTLVRQYSAQNESLGKNVEEHIKELSETGTIKEVNPNLALLFNPKNYSFLAEYLVLNPQEEIKKLNIPVLIINGTKDIQVKEKDAENLLLAKPDAKMVIIENMNHVLKNIEKDEDNLASYSSPDFPLSQKLVLLLEDFIKQ
ncbi:alpha/beta hydrolase [Subsaxibacter sp. CAU 1640]|uniref:alpha/beta hydrolase n=1 Tax=Subsaxibacter sp. CAU 1640 TaxID=2933271 RepID=UPI0020068727|nr:alpha/beta fold hydrolase [Subsaxibacter sp. CAU 1640]MCK7590025.1 alpha/beta hydrolase [Subsaxibacter sp. CAU 1640]